MIPFLYQQHQRWYIYLLHSLSYHYRLLNLDQSER